MENNQAPARLLLVSVFLVAAAGLVYELIAGTLATYLLGSSITVFSVVIGLFMAAMGLGAWLAQFAKRNLAQTFVIAELALALLGGLSALLLFAAFIYTPDSFHLVVGLVSVAIGALVGLEIPILLRILEANSSIRLAVSRVLAVDYLGALLGSLLFPFLLLPYLGLVRTAALLGLVNLGVAFVALRVLADLPKRRLLMRSGYAVAGVLLLTFFSAAQTTSWAEDSLYQDPIVLSRTTPYQRIVLTRWRNDHRLFINGHLQFSSVDEYRYHEALIHPVLSAVKQPKRVLILGGGDGLAARRVLQHKSVEKVDLVDLDSELLDLFKERSELRSLNGDALNDSRVSIHAVDGLRFVAEAKQGWDAIIMDLPDPNDDTLARLYARSSFRLYLSRLNPGGALVTQATSPLFAPKAFWCLAATIESVAAAGQQVRPFHVNVPSFGEWGFVMLSTASSQPPRLAPGLELSFLDQPTSDAMFHFPKDLTRPEVEVNRLSTAVVAEYYRQGWRQFN